MGSLDGEFLVFPEPPSGEEAEDNDGDGGTGSVGCRTGTGNLIMESGDFEIKLVGLKINGGEGLLGTETEGEPEFKLEL